MVLITESLVAPLDENLAVDSGLKMIVTFHILISAPECWLIGPYLQSTMAKDVSGVASYEHTCT